MQKFLREDQERTAAQKREEADRNERAEILRAIKEGRDAKALEPIMLPTQSRTNRVYQDEPTKSTTKTYLVNTPSGLKQCRETNGYIRCN